MFKNRFLLLYDEGAAYQIVGEVTAHQVNDEYLCWEAIQTQWDWDTAHTPTGGSSREFFTMGETLMKQCRVNNEGFRIVKFFYMGRMVGGGNATYSTVPYE